jgi:PAS domain S-box-containing protein
VSTATQAVVFNGVPLLCLALADAVVAAVLMPALWRGRRESNPLDIATGLVFPAIGCSALVLGVLVIVDRQPLAGHLWPSFVAILLAFIPALLFLVRWQERGVIGTVMRRVRAAEDRVTVLDREFEAVTAITNALARATDAEAASLPLLRQVRELLGIEFAAVAVIDDDAAVARGVAAELLGEDVPWWRDLRLDLRNEPSGIASTVFDAAPVMIYDVRTSPRVSRKLVELVNAKSGLWVPMIAEERVAGVLIVCTTVELRTFSAEEVALLQALAGETALALDRMRSSAALAAALEREQLGADIARRIRAELEADDIIRVATAELQSAFALDEIAVELGGTAETADAFPIVVAGSTFGSLRIAREQPLDEGERYLVQAAAEEIGLALHTARLLSENRRRLDQYSALLHAAHVVTSELDLDAVLPRLVEEAAKLLGADAADCYLLDADHNVLRCAAVHGLDPDLLGFECRPDQGATGLALRRGRPVIVDDYELMQLPNAAYSGYAKVMVAPMSWRGETRGVLGVGVRDRDRRLGDADTSLLEAFTGLAALALQNAELYGERARQARVQRAFHRITSLLSERLSLPDTLAATARAAAEALGGDYAAVLMPVRGRLAIVGEHALPDAVRALEPPQALVEAAADEQLLVAARLGDDDRFGDDWRELPAESLLAVPVESDGAGIVVVFCRDPRAFSEDDLELARQLAYAANGAFERSRLYEAERTARSLSQRLARTASMLTAALGPEAVLQEAVQQALSLVAADAATVTLLDQTAGLVVAAAEGDEVELAAVVGTAAPAVGWHGGDVVQLRAPVSRDDRDEDGPGAGADPLLALGYRSYLGVPLAAREGSVLGVLAVYGRAPRSWPDEVIEALSALAANAAVALSNAELYQRIAVEHDQSAAILSSIAEGIVAVDREGRVVVWNAAAEEITGVPAEEALGRTPAEVIQRDLESELGGSNRLVSVDRGGEEVTLSLSETLMHDPTGAVAGRVFAFRDISAEWVLEKMKSDFVSTVSHELRAPLTSIYGFAETLLREDVRFSETERRTFLGYIASESSRLTAIVDALIDVARLDRGDITVALASTDLGEVINESISTVGARDGHRFEIDLGDGELAVRADPDKLRQVLDQLVENAVKYSPGGGVVRVEARRRRHAVEVSVTDEGIGIPLAHRDRVFDKFYRVDEDVAGTGLGLFIARGLVSAMGGRLRLDGERSRGSRFTFELPVGRQE